MKILSERLCESCETELIYPLHLRRRAGRQTLASETRDSPRSS